MAVEGVGPKLIPAEITSSSCGYGWVGVALYGLIAETCLQYLGDLAFCFPETYGGGELWEKFVGPGYGILLLKVWWCYHPMDCFDT